MLELSACVLFVRVSHRADCLPERDLLSISTRKELANPFTHFSTSLLTEVFMQNSALQDIAALLGCPAAGNPAQYLFEHAITATGLDWRFLTFDVSPDSLRDALKGIESLGFRGCVLDGPLRGQATPFMAGASPAATFSKAVDLVSCQKDGLFGHMTIGRGLVEAIRPHIDVAGSRVFLVGAGPAARAIALELALAQVKEIFIANRSAPHATSLLNDLRELPGVISTPLEWGPHLEVPSGVHLVVNATTSGIKPAFELSQLRPDLVVADLALLSHQSPILDAAMKAGASVVNGLDIRAEATAIDFQILTDIKPDTEMLREALDEFLAA